MRAIIVGLVIVGVGAAWGCRGKTATTPAAAPAAQGAGVNTAPASVAEFPDYPGASRVMFAERERRADDPRKVAARFVTTDSLAAVKAHYQRLVAEGGWAVVKFREEPDEVKWQLARGLSEVEIELEARSPGTVAIAIERKDR